MERQKDIRAIAMIYIILLLGNIAVCGGSEILGKWGINVPLMLQTFLCELVILGPVIYYLRSRRENIFSGFGFHKIKFSTVLLTVILTIVVTPIFMFVNLLSQLFVSNYVVQNTSEITEGTIAATIIMTVIVAPLFEEMTFRGFFFNKIKDKTSVLKAALITGLLFGIMHLNLNQFCYAAVLGFFFALANEASGSTWPSVIMHFLINGVNVVSLVIATMALRQQNIDLAEVQEAQRMNTGFMLYSIAIYGVIAIVCTFIAWFIIKAIARNQGNLESFKEKFTYKKCRENSLSES